MPQLIISSHRPMMESHRAAMVRKIQVQEVNK
jgi:hypothetical protein